MIRTRSAFKLVAVSAFAALGGLVVAKDDVQMSVSPLIPGTVRIGKGYPLKVVIENTGAATDGEVTFSDGDQPITRPVSLPADSKTTFVAYVPANGIFGISQGEAVLTTSKGISRVPLEPEDFVTSGRILEVGTDAENRVYGVPDGVTGRKTPVFGQLFSKPAGLPERSVGYTPFLAVVLEKGAEQMSDAAAHALKEYVLGGGIVTALDNKALQKDPRFKGCFLDDTSGQVIGFTLENRTWGPVPYGTGCFLYTSSMTKDVISNLQRGKFSGNTVNGAGIVQAIDVNLRDGLNYSESGPIVRAGPAVANSDITAASFDQNYSSNPFQLHLPPAETVIGILALYFILVVPVNLLVLRKIGKSEWAWVTSPIISIAFAAIFFHYAGGLYNSQLAHETVGVVVADATGEDAMYVGWSQIFFPKGGNYDLGIKNLQTASQRDLNAAFQGGNTLRVADYGSRIDSSMDVGNLSFQQLHFQQGLSQQKWVAIKSITLRSRSAMTLDVTLSNESPYTLSNCILALPTWWGAFGDLAPHETRTEVVGLKSGTPTFSDAFSDMPGHAAGVPYQDTSFMQLPSDRTMLTSTISSDFQPGPQVGTNIAATSLLLEDLGSQGSAVESMIAVSSEKTKGVTPPGSFGQWQSAAHPRNGGAK